MFRLFFVVTSISIATFSVSYLYFLGLRIIRNKLDDKTGDFFNALIVGFAILAAIVTLEAVFLIGIERKVAGSLFYVATFLGAIVLGIGTAGIAGWPKPISVALAHRKAAIWGLVLGNFFMVIINILSFWGMLPSVL